MLFVHDMLFVLSTLISMNTTCMNSRFCRRGARISSLAVAILGLCSLCTAQKLAITFDDLPLNGALAQGVTRTEIARSAVAILREHNITSAYGFINARKLEDNADAAEALKIWAAAEPVGNHTYSHMDLNANTVDAFEHDVAENEPVLELLQPSSDWHWLRYPYLNEGETLEKRNAVRNYLATHHYKIAQVTVEWGDYFWNTAYARCAAKDDKASIDWLHTSYLKAAAEHIAQARAQSQALFGHDINYVLLLHLGSFSSTILPDALDLLKKSGFEIVSLEEAESDPIYAIDPAEGGLTGGTFLDQLMSAKKLTAPAGVSAPQKELESICH